MTKTVEFASGIAATHDQRITAMSLYLGRTFGRMTTSGPVLSGMGSFVTFASQLMSGISYGVFVRLSRRVSRLKRIHEFPFRAGRVN